MGDAGVGKQPLQVRLEQRGEVAQDHRRDRDGHEHRAPLRRELRQREREHAEQPGERADLRHDRHERRDGQRRALVDVGRPGVERHQRGLETEPDRQQRDPDAEQRRERRLRDRRQVDRAGRPVDQRDPVDEERGRERPEQQVLQPGLLRPPAVARQRRQRVQREAQDLQPEEQDDQVAARPHEDRARRAEQEERVVLPRRQAEPLEIDRSEQHREPRARRARRA